MKADTVPDGLVRYFSPQGIPEDFPPPVREALGRIQTSLGAGRSLDDVMDVVWEATEGLLPRDRIGVSFIEEDEQRVVLRYWRATYDGVKIAEGYQAGLAGSSLERIQRGGMCRIIDNLEAYLDAYPSSVSTRLLVAEKVMSNLTLPLRVEDRNIGFLFLSSRQPEAFGEDHAHILLAVSDRISQSVEKAWIIKRLTDAKAGYLSTLGFVAHEVKSPLASLITLGKTYLEGYLGKTEEQAEKTVGRMVQLAGYLVNMVGNYLDLSRLDSGEMRHSPEDDVRVIEDIVKFAVDAVSPRAEERRSTITVQLPDREILLRADPELLRIAAVNLIDNAVKYGYDDAEVLVTVRLEGEELVLSVRNHGVGFTVEESRLLFQRFKRLRQKGTEDRKGSGLGLYITWWIVQQHRGRIEACSEPGEWAEFTVRLPEARLG